MTKSLSTKGGARPGAGRKRAPTTERFQILITPAQREKIKVRGGAKWVRSLIDAS